MYRCDGWEMRNLISVQRPYKGLILDVTKV